MDSVAEIVLIKDSDIGSAASTVEGNDFVMGIHYHQEKLYILLSVEKLLSRDEAT